MLNHMYLFCIDLAKVNPDAGTEELIGYSGVASSLGLFCTSTFMGAATGLRAALHQEVRGEAIILIWSIQVLTVYCGGCIMYHSK